AAAIDEARRALAPYAPGRWPEFELSCARLLGALYGAGGEWEDAAATLRLGVEALDALYRRQLLRGAREAWLRKAGGVHVEAAHASVRAGDVEGAVAMLEHGRARILSDALARDRADLTQLRELGRGDLLDRYRSASARLAAVERVEDEDGLRGAAEA